MLCWNTIISYWLTGSQSSVDNQVSRHDTNKSRQAQAMTLSLEKLSLTYTESIKKGSQADCVYREERDVFISTIKLGLW